MNNRFLTRPRTSKQVPIPEVLEGRVVAQDNAVSFTSEDAQRLLGKDNDTMTMYKSMHVTPFATIPPHVVNRCFDVIREGVPFGVMERLNAELHLRGFEFTRADDDLLPQTPMKPYVQRVLMQLQKDALQAIAAIGVVPICFLKDQVTGLIEPYVPAPKTYTIRVASFRGRTIYQLQWVYPDMQLALQRQRRPGKGNSPHDRLAASTTLRSHVTGAPDLSAIVLADFGYNPDVDTRLCSPAHSFLEAVNLHSDLRQCAITAEKINANPPLARQRDDNDDSTNHPELRNTEYVGSGVVNQHGQQAADRVSRQYVRDAEQQAVYQSQEREIAHGLGAVAGTLPGVGVPTTVVESHRYDARSGTDAHGNAMPWANDIILAPGWKPASYHLPQPRHDLTAVLTYLDDRVFLNMLIPRTVLEANSRISADAEVAKSGMDVVTTIWGRLLSRVLTFAYDATFMWDDMVDAYKQIVKRKQIDKQQTSSNDILNLRVSQAELTDILNQVSTVIVGFTEPKKATSQELRFAHARGELNWDTYTAAQAQQLGIPISQMAAADPYPAEARRIVGNPEYAEYLRLELDREKERNRHAEALRHIKLKKDDVAQKRKADDQPAVTDDDNDNDQRAADRPQTRSMTKKKK